jgi:hypothetical protein
VASEDPPKQPRERSERRKQGNSIAEISHRIADIGHQISVAIRDLGNQIFALTNQIHADNKTTDTREKENQDRSFHWVKVGTISSIVLSVFSLVTSGIALYVLNNQLYSMRVDHRAWITIEDIVFKPVEENKPLTVEFKIVNTGKTPAKHVNMFLSVEKVASSSSPTFTPPSLKSFFGLISPNSPYIETVESQKDKPDPFTPLLLTRTDVDEIKSGKSYIAAIATIEYLDIYDISHWVHHCFWKSEQIGTYTARQCVNYNQIDNN